MEALIVGCPLLKTASFLLTPRVTKRTLQSIVTNKRLLRKLSFCEAAIRQRDIDEFRKQCAAMGMLPVPNVNVSLCTSWL